MPIKCDTQVLGFCRIHRSPYWLKPVMPDDYLDRLASGACDRLDLTAFADSVKFTLGRSGLGAYSGRDTTCRDFGEIPRTVRVG